MYNFRVCVRSKEPVRRTAAERQAARTAEILQICAFTPKFAVAFKVV